MHTYTYTCTCTYTYTYRPALAHVQVDGQSQPLHVVVGRPRCLLMNRARTKVVLVKVVS